MRLISDEIYHGIVYEGDTVSAVEVSDSAIVVNSFSKYFSMTGWRVGWLVVPPDLVRPIERLSQNFFISVPTLSQHAALAAFDGKDELDGHVRRYRANRDLLLAGLPAAGFDRFAPAEGAFYLYCDVAHLTNDSRDFCRRMLAEAGVATTPGVDFDRARGAGTLAHLLRRLDRRDGGSGAAIQGLEARYEIACGRCRCPSPRGSGLCPRRAERPSFECAKASNAIERTICKDPGLAKADREMAAAYAALAGKLAGAAKDDLAKEQLHWIGDRNRACATDTDGIAPCLRKSLRGAHGQPQGVRRRRSIPSSRAVADEERQARQDRLLVRYQLSAVSTVQYGRFFGHQRALRRRGEEGG